MTPRSEDDACRPVTAALRAREQDDEDRNEQNRTIVSRWGAVRARVRERGGDHDHLKDTATSWIGVPARLEAPAPPRTQAPGRNTQPPPHGDHIGGRRTGVTRGVKEA